MSFQYQFFKNIIKILKEKKYFKFIGPNKLDLVVLSRLSDLNLANDIKPNK